MGICSDEKRKLIEEVGLHFETYKKLPPLAARIYAIMVLSSEEGYSFEEIMQITQASKSSVSTNINLLQQLNYIEYYTKPGDRKRYFKGANSYLRSTLEGHLQSLEKELAVISKINTFNKRQNPQKFIANRSIGLIFQDYLISQRENLINTIEKILDFQKEAQNPIK
tara:strand:+ start:573 stop:1073 length:501 start_codon:yes stop_codon:yes gene_type:complete